MDIVDLIKDDHEEITELLEKLNNTSSDDLEERGSLFSDLRGVLEAHTQSEERILYERVEDEDDLRGLILESYEDHTLVVELLQALSEMEYNNEEWMAKFDVLRETVDHHREEEEEKVLPEIQRLISDEEREEMGDDMKSLEEEILSSGPEMVTQTPAQSHIGTDL